MKPVVSVLNGVLTLLALCVVALGAGAVWFAHQIEQPGPTTSEVRFIVRPGDGAQLVADRLSRDGIVSSRTLFFAHYLASHYLARLQGRQPVLIKAGEYAIAKQASVRGVLTQLNQGRSVLHGVTIPEGLTSQQIVDRLNSDPALTGEIEQVPAEGSLLADTYRLPPGATRQAALDAMSAEQRKVLDELWAARRPGLPLKTPQEAVTLASIVQREMGPNDSAERVAAVFINRLRKSMRLQSDPTVLYGQFGGHVPWGRPIYRSDLQSKTAYNTYHIDGLPPGPIANPGREALKAVLNPAETKELYFVADGKGGHIFAETLAEHNANVTKWRAIEREIRARQKAAKEEKEASAQAVTPVAARTGQAPPSKPIAATALAVPSTVSTEAAALPSTTAANADTTDNEVPLPVRRPKR